MKRFWLVVSALFLGSMYLGASQPAMAKKLRRRLPKPVTDADFQFEGSPAAAKVELGKLLFFDKELSGNRNISCATCHHPFGATSDGLSLPIGEGASGFGVTRDTGAGLAAVLERVPRNSPQLFNLGAKEVVTMFHDGRVAGYEDTPGQFDSPAGGSLPEGLESALAVQAMFPVTSGTEMAGQAGENPIADAAAAGNLSGAGGVWERLADRLKAIPAYVTLFTQVYDDVDGAEDITFVHAANAIAAFEGKAWRADNSPFDRYLRGEGRALSVSAKRGMQLFYGKANCSTCHSGCLQTDQDFHAIAMPQIGPGKGDGPDGRDDFGRERVTGDAVDRFRFRTPSLRQVAQTAPYGHAGAFDTLEAVVRHHLDPVASLQAYDQAQARLPSRGDLDALDFVVMDTPARVQAIANANDLEAVELSDKQIGYLIDFLHALTDPRMIDLRRDVPKAVPSGLTLFD